jgi:hypothetical protein
MVNISIESFMSNANKTIKEKIDSIALQLEINLQTFKNGNKMG